MYNSIDDFWGCLGNIQVNVSASGTHVHNSLKKTTKHTTMPNVFIKGKHVGM